MQQQFTLNTENFGFSYQKSEEKIIIGFFICRFSFKFKESCKADIVQNCPTEIRTKAEVVACLSEIARNDILTEKEPKTLSNNCRKQLQFQLLQKHSSINLNPKIFKNCKKAIQKNCKIGEGNVLECLKSLNHNMMSAKCRQAVFEEQQEEVLIDGVDHELLIGKNCFNFTEKKHYFHENTLLFFIRGNIDDGS